MGMNTKTEAQALTVQRASTKWVFNSQGILTEVPVDTLAHEHDPVTLEYQGVLVEPERTNAIPNSTDLSSWVVIRAEVVLAGVPSFIEGHSVYKISDTTSDNLTHMASVTPLTLSPGEYCVASFFVKPAEKDILYVSVGNVSATRCFLRYIFSTGYLIVGQGGSDYINPKGSVTPLADGWFYVVLSCQRSPALSGQVEAGVGIQSGVDLIYPGEPGKGVYVIAPQLEKGEYPTSYIPTNGAPVTRVADVLQRTLGVERNPLQDTLVLDVANAQDLKLFPEYSDTLEVSGTGKAVVTHNGQQGSMHIAGSELVAFSDFTAGNVLTLAAGGKGHLRNLSYYPYAVADANSEATGALTNAWEPDSLFADGTAGAFIDASSEGV